MTLPRIPGWLPYDQVHGKHSTVTGTVFVWPSLNSPELSRSREITVYVPPSLASGEDKGRRYSVIYFHDGQNVFDSKTSYVGEWHVDETLEKLARGGIEAIAVGIPNAADDRMDEYSPWRGRSGFGRRLVGGSGGAYLEWLVESVKPMVDRSFPTRTDREGTGTMGSSLGGLISLYAVAKYPHVFGFVGAMSPSLRWHDYKIEDLFVDWAPPRPRIHLDMGGREFKGLTTDARRMRDVLLASAWVMGRDLQYVEDRYGRHHEESWSRRLPDALRFLLAEAAVVEAAEPGSAA
ncbi:MAG: alpha/beta hydrolase-fold protein [Chloroflexota bacterium]